MQVTELTALEVLDSRGRPTLQVALTTGTGGTYVAGVPSGASKGRHEAVERRDGDDRRYGGFGVLGAVAAVTGPLAAAVTGRRWTGPADLDEALVATDGTAERSRLGANAIVGVSMAAARAFAAEAGTPLYRYLMPDGRDPRLPVPHFNVLNGGAHAPNPLDFQEFMIAPLGAPGFGTAADLVDGAPFRRAAGVLTCAAACTRLLLAVHWPSDVAAALAFSAGWRALGPAREGPR